jgi:hypothetical protein
MAVVEVFIALLLSLELLDLFLFKLMLKPLNVFIIAPQDAVGI